MTEMQLESLDQSGAGFYEVRARRWKVFLYLFVLTCVAISLDLITTYLGFQKVGSSFEQNGIALYLINSLGWAGITALLALACAVCVKSFKLVYWRMGVRWSLWLNLMLAAVCLFRWLVVITDTLWLIRH